MIVLYPLFKVCLIECPTRIGCGVEVAIAVFVNETEEIENHVARNPPW